MLFLLAFDRLRSISSLKYFFTRLMSFLNLLMALSIDGSWSGLFITLLDLLVVVVVVVD